ncbi:MAG TPA: sugar ABC transporter permease [Thermoanaerobaculia bacterium]|nr:sugar ABC transporter permease [Thermoanaerobaculia bacterium]
MLWLAPALGTIALVALFPLVWTFWESLHRHDLRMPWLGRPFVGLGNYAEMLGDGRFLGAIGRTLLFALASVTLEVGLGLAAALLLHRRIAGLGALRTAILLPWALPTVVAAMLWRFLFDSEAGAVALMLERSGARPVVWFAHEVLAWVPIVLADVWKTTPFVALLLLAGLQQIPREVEEAAAIDGAGAWRRLVSITLPMIRPMLLVAIAFRSLDALRVFDLIYVLSGGGPGTATEPIALYTFNAYFQNLRFGYGSALAVALFVMTVAIGAVSVRLFAKEPA